MFMRLIAKYKWVMVPLFMVAVLLPWLVFIAQGQVLPMGGLLSGLVLIKTLPAIRLVGSLNQALAPQLNSLQVGGGLLVPSLVVRRLWLAAGRTLFVERWLWLLVGRLGFLARTRWLLLFTHSRAKRLLGWVLTILPN